MLKLWALTMIDPATGWLEIKDITTKQADNLSNVLEQTCLTRYPRPSVITLDRGSEFMAEVSQLIKNDYSIKKKSITVRNPQTNAIIERVHQTIANIVRTFDLNNMEVEEENPRSGILTATMFAIWSTVYTTSGETQYWTWHIQPTGSWSKHVSNGWSGKTIYEKIENAFPINTR